MSFLSSNFKSSYRSIRAFVLGIFFLFTAFFLPSCEFFETKVEEYLLQFNSSAGTLEQVIVDGYLLIDGQRTDISLSNLTELSVSEKWIRLTIYEGRDIYYLTVPSFNKDFNIVEEYLDDVMTFVSVFHNTLGGIGSVSNYSVEATDTYEGAGSFQLSGVGELESTSTGQVQDLVFEMDFDFDTSRTGGSLGTGGGSSGGGTGSGGSGSASCDNTIQISQLLSYWPQIGKGDAVGTGKKVAGNTIFSNLKPTDVGLVVDGTSGDTRYVVQILLTPGNLVANKSLDFIHAGRGAPLTSSGAVGILIAIKGGVNDGWQTNYDYGENRDTGNLFIESVSPQIRGTYEFEAYGDGFDNVKNKQLVRLKGEFCIDP